MLSDLRLIVFAVAVVAVIVDDDVDVAARVVAASTDYRSPRTATGSSIQNRTIRSPDTRHDVMFA